MSQNALALTKAELRDLGEIAADENFHNAAVQFLLLREHKIRPSGRYDKAGHFLLQPDFECCTGIRQPSRKFPLSVMDHGRTAIHVAYAHGIQNRTKELRRYALLLHKYSELQTSTSIWRALVLKVEAQAVLQEISQEPPPRAK